jgi:hypothetical protein
LLEVFCIIHEIQSSVKFDETVLLLKEYYDKEFSQPIKGGKGINVKNQKKCRKIYYMLLVSILSPDFSQEASTVLEEVVEYCDSYLN